jgi:esterase/lipase superfamily enzyme
MGAYCRLNGMSDKEGLYKIYCRIALLRTVFYNKHIHPSIARKPSNTTNDMPRNCGKSKNNTPSGRLPLPICSFGDIMLPILPSDTGYVSHMFSMSGAFNIKSFLEGFHNDDVFFNGPVIYMD